MTPPSLRPPRSLAALARHLAAALPALALALLTACSRPPPPDHPSAEDERIAKEDARRFCNVDTLAGIDPDDPVTTSMARHDWLTEHLEHPGSQAFLTYMKVRTDAENSRELRRLAKEAALAECPLATTLEAE